MNFKSIMKMIRSMNFQIIQINNAHLASFASCICLGLIHGLACNVGQAQELPLVTEATVFEEKDGLLAVEAEHFFSQKVVDKRKFYLTTKDITPTIAPDGDPNHVGGASNGAYLEVLPDTRRTHDDELFRGENFSNKPGTLAIVSYKIHVNNPGRYYIWVRAYSTGSEDNGLHVGVNGTWPDSGRRIQWCDGKNSWRWESKQRTKEQHCGVPHGIYLDIEKAGEHVVHFSMREDGFEFDKWLMTRDRDFKRPEDAGPASVVKSGPKPKSFPLVAAPAKPMKPAKDAGYDDKNGSSDEDASGDKSDQTMVLPRKPDGDGTVTVSGELKTWHKITLDLNGPYAHENDRKINPFTDQRMLVKFFHPDGIEYRIPGYFAADGNAANSSAQSGTVWRAHFAPDRPGVWSYEIEFKTGSHAAIDWSKKAKSVPGCDRSRGSIEVAATDKLGRDLRTRGRLQYVGKRYLQHAGSGDFFLKFGADSPETLLAFKDFDNTSGGRKNAPLKTFAPHVADWKDGDPSWGDGRGKGLIGAVSYLAGKGCNAFSFLTYNAGGDGDSVWPYVDRDDKLHFDCSKLDQWGIVFDYGTQRGMYLHFKLQETEIDDNRVGPKKENKMVQESLDGGELGVQRKVYLKEIIARFGHNLALNWNLGEENTQSSKQQRAMIDFIQAVDAYDHHIVVHTYPNQQDKVYSALLGTRSALTGISVQNSGINQTHRQTVKWVNKSQEAGRPWVVAFDEAGTAAHASCPDLGYQGFDGRDADGKMIHTQHDVRKRVLWGNLMGGGAGVEYYFGYKFPENDLKCEDWRSRDQSWDYGRIAIEFFHDQKIPFAEMKNHNRLVGNAKNNNKRYCFAKPGEVYLVYLPDGGSADLDLASAEKATFSVRWFNPRSGGQLVTGDVAQVEGGKKVNLGQPPADANEDWLVVIR
jgi:hypothetical protein